MTVVSAGIALANVALPDGFLNAPKAAAGLLRATSDPAAAASCDGTRHFHGARWSRILGFVGCVGRLLLPRTRGEDESCNRDGGASKHGLSERWFVRFGLPYTGSGVERAAETKVSQNRTARFEPSSEKGR